ncbi:AGAP000714-PA-like protein [Anopheles sinensis]|uniref:AGAP000714-PA-like protein n=1 Tax=Anopheles sinensis TaxID=74873 RepID=A0A084VV42_ANOSI|nr:AGAP000714-PA-like protein [Anopheles sinensis]
MRQPDADEASDQNVTDAAQRQRFHNLFVVDDHVAFRRVSNAMSKRLFDYSGYYTVLVMNPDYHRALRSIQTILSDLWMHYVINVAVLVAVPTRRTKALVYTFFPYGKEHCEHVRPVVWNVYDHTAGRFEHSERDLFPAKMENFFGCPLTVATFSIYPFIIPEPMGRLEGIEGLLLEALRVRFNFKLEVVLVEPPDWGIAGPRADATGASLYIRQRRANLTIGYWATTLHRNQYMANSVSYYTSLLVLAVPPGAPYTSLEKFRFPFRAPVWLLLLLMLVIGSLVIGLLRRRHVSIQRLVFGAISSHPWFSMINVLLGGGLYRQPGRNFARALLIQWLAGTLILRNAYTGSMFKFLQAARNHSTPETVPALLEAGYELYMYRNYSFVFDANPVIKRQVRIVTAQKFRRETLLRLQHPRERLAVLVPIETLTFLNRNLSREGLLLRLARDRVYVAKLAIYSQHASPLITPFNRVLEMFASAGLIARWAGRYHQKRFLIDQHRQRRTESIVLSDMSGKSLV